MSKQRFSPEFKEEAVKLVAERNYSVSEVSARLGCQTQFRFDTAVERKRGQDLIHRYVG